MNGDSDSRLLESGPSSAGPPEQPGLQRMLEAVGTLLHMVLLLLLLLLLLCIGCAGGWMNARVREARQPALPAAAAAAAACCLSHLQLQQRGRPVWPRKAEPQACGVWPAGSRLGRPLRLVLFAAGGWSKRAR